MSATMNVRDGRVSLPGDYLGAKLDSTGWREVGVACRG